MNTAYHRSNAAPEWDKRLVRELAWVLAIKTTALFALWLAFFSEPIDHTLTDATIHQTLFTSPATGVQRQSSK